MCNKIVTNEINGSSPQISLLQFYSEQLSKIYENDELKQRLFQISFHNSNVVFTNINKIRLQNYDFKEV